MTIASRLCLFIFRFIYLFISPSGAAFASIILLFDFISFIFYFAGIKN